MLELGLAGVDGVGDADPGQAGEGEMVVEQEDLGGVEHTLDVLPGLGVVGTPPHVLHHVQRPGDVFIGSLQHLVQEVNIPELPTHCRSRLIFHHVGSILVLNV